MTVEAPAVIRASSALPARRTCAIGGAVGLARALLPPLNRAKRKRDEEKGDHRDDVDW